jgi:hypothetical protein
MTPRQQTLQDNVLPDCTLSGADVFAAGLVVTVCRGEAVPPEGASGVD